MSQTLSDTALQALKLKAIAGTPLTDDEAYSLLDADKEALYAAAEEITAAIGPRRFETCSIINARSGRCSENCKWCAQSGHYNTGCRTYPIVSREECLDMARRNHQLGIQRFSMVASGRSVKGEPLRQMCEMIKEVKEQTGMQTCASMGLLGHDELQQLWDSGVRRYHCNLEAAPSHFATLCTTHTIDDKMSTIRTARQIGFEVCSGGIIGMGETPRQRVEFALKLREAQPVSIPINILCPIPGTPLADTPPLTDDEVLTTMAIFRFVHPRVHLRFAGGSASLSEHTRVRAMRIAINSGIMGEMLTTSGSGSYQRDVELIHDAGYDLSPEG